MLDFLLRLMDIIERVRTASSVSDIAMIGFGILLVFGFINCILGYRLLRFWMMIFGFVIGAGLGLGAAFTMGGGDRFTLTAAAVGVGVVLAVIAFLSYKVGIFVLGAGLGLGVGVYVLHPTTSLMFFLCILLGVLLGSLAMKWAREVIIVGTSILGGAMAGVSLAKLGGLPDIPYGIVLSIAFALLGMLIQFATNRRRTDDYEEDEIVEEKEPPRRRRSSAAVSAAERRRTEPERRQRSAASGRTRQIDYRLDEPAPENEKTVDFRPRRRRELDLPLDSFDQDDRYNYGYRSGSGTRNGYRTGEGNRSFAYNPKDKPDYDADYAPDYDEDYDSEEPIDEDLLDEEILKEMMEEEDRKTDLFWEKISGKKSREKKKNGKRSKN